MIQLEFQPQNSSLTTGTPTFISGMGPELVASTCFNHRVRFNVEGVELFENVSYDRAVYICQVDEEVFGQADESEPSSPWISIPLLHFATAGFEKVRSTLEGNAEIYNLPNGGNLQFLPRGEQVEIVSSFSSRSVRASRVELSEAFEAFSAQVRQFLIQQMPELRDHPGWRTWFGEK